MSNYFKGFAAVSIFAAVAVFVLTGFGLSSNAGSKTMEERYAAAGDKKLPAAETKGIYDIDKAHSYVGFHVRHMGLVDIPGSFNEFEGAIDFDSSKIKNSTVEFTANVKSIDTRVNGRDNHLRSKDFFEVENYPSMSFKSTKVKKRRGNKYRVYGNLTIKGKTREIMIPFRIYGPIKDQRGTLKMGIEGETSINRRDYDINYGGNLPTGVPVIGDQVTVLIRLETVMRKETTAAGK